MYIGKLFAVYVSLNNNLKKNKQTRKIVLCRTETPKASAELHAIKRKKKKKSKMLQTQKNEKEIKKKKKIRVLN